MKLKCCKYHAFEGLAANPFHFNLSQTVQSITRLQSYRVGSGKAGTAIVLLLSITGASETALQ